MGLLDAVGCCFIACLAIVSRKRTDFGKECFTGDR
jgi:hypothetical protein